MEWLKMMLRREYLRLIFLINENGCRSKHMSIAFEMHLFRSVYVGGFVAAGHRNFCSNRFLGEKIRQRKFAIDTSAIQNRYR